MRLPILLPETVAQIKRVQADGGTIISPVLMDQAIRKLKIFGIYSSCVLLQNANFAVKKDGSNAVSKLYDISGNDNDATQTTGASQPIWQATGGANGAALAFDGSDDYVSCGNAVGNFGVEDFTIIVWAALQGNILYSPPLINKRLDSGTYNQFTFRQTLNNLGQLNLTTYNNAASLVSTIGTAYNDNRFRQYVGVRLGTSMYIYVNGIIENIATGQTIRDINNSSPLLLGAISPNADDHRLQGSESCISIYNRGLSDEEIAAVYAAGL